MGYFFDYLDIPHEDIEEGFEIFTRKVKANLNWLVNIIFSYLQHHKGRVERKEISGGIRNFLFLSCVA